MFQCVDVPCGWSIQCFLDEHSLGACSVEKVLALPMSCELLLCVGGWGTCNTYKNPLFFHFWYGFWTHKLILFLSVLREERIIWVRAHWQIYVPIFVSYKFRYFLLAEIAGTIWLSNFCDLLYGPVCVPDRHPIQIQCWQRKQEEALNSKRLDFNG